MATCAFAQGSGTVTTQEFLVRDGWTATGCTQCSNTGANQDGVAQLVLDNDPTTYWHSNWTICKTQAYHWLVIDMKSEQTVKGFDYLPRPNSSNGTWITGKAYVSNTDPAMDITKATSLYTGSTQVGSFSAWPTANPSAYRTCEFPTQVSGQYLIIITSSQGGGSTGNTFASCAELKPWHMVTRELTPIQFTPVFSGDGTNCRLTRDDSSTSVWKSKLEPLEGATDPCPIITASNFRLPRVNNMQVDNGVLDVRKGLEGTEGTYTITCNSDLYFVSHVQFTAVGSANDVQIRFPYRSATAISTTGVDFSADFTYGQPAQFFVSGSNGTACKLTNLQITLQPKTDAALARAALFNQIYDFFELWKPILGEELYSDFNPNELYIFASNMNNDETAVNALFNPKRTTAMSKLNGRPIHIQNSRRSGQPYLVMNTASTINTNPAKVDEAAWYIVADGNEGKFKLYNLARCKYIARSGGNFTVADDGIQFVLARYSSDNSVTAIKLFDSNNGLNMANNTNNGGFGDITDAGSAWSITPWGLPYNQITDGKYVRIRSARSMDKNKRSKATYPGSLIGVQTVVENGAAANVDTEVRSTCSSGLGTIWKVEAVSGEAGKFYLRNLAADFAATGEDPNYYDNCGKPGKVKLPSSTDKGKFTFNSSYVGTGNYSTGVAKSQNKIPTAVGIFNTTNNLYLDTNGDNSYQMGNWAHCDNNWPNNGGLYFLEECGDVEAIKAAYIAATTSTAGAAPADKISHHAGNFSNYAETIRLSSTATTVGQANIWAGAHPNALPWRTDAGMHAPLATALDGTYAVVKGHYVEGGTRRYLASNSTFANAEKSADLSADPLLGIWKFEKTSDGNKVIIRNEKSGKYIKQHATQGTPLPLVSDGSQSQYYVYFDHTKNVNGDGYGGFGFSTNATDRGDNNSGIHFAGTICRWGLGADASWVDLVSLDNDLPISESNEIISGSDPRNGAITIDFGDATVVNATGDTRVVTVRQTARRRPTTEPLPSWTFTSQDIIDAGKRIQISNGTPGTYEIEIPMAFFSRDGKFNAPITRTLAETTTGITDEMEIYPEEQVIYDLQGRRVAAPTHGIYIINGRKVKM